MKFYSEITKEMYDTVEALEAAELKIQSTDKIFELLDNLADKQCEVLMVAAELAAIMGDKFTVPAMTVCPDGSLEVDKDNETIRLDANTGDIVSVKNKTNSPKADEVKVKMPMGSSVTMECKVDPIEFEDILGLFSKPHVNGTASATPVVKNLSGKEVQSLLDALKSL